MNALPLVEEMEQAYLNRDAAYDGIFCWGSNDGDLLSSNLSGPQPPSQECRIPSVHRGSSLRRVPSVQAVHPGTDGFGLIAHLPLFREGLFRLKGGASRYRIALLCGEKDPLTCHRAILVCRHLCSLDLAIAHIRHNGQLESHTSLEDQLLRAVRIDGKNLLSSREEAINYAYDLQSEKIAYIENGEPREEKD